MLVNKEYKTNVGILFIYIYILLSYIGKQEIMDEQWQSLSLYLLLGVCLLTILYFGRFRIVQYHIWYISFICLSLISCLYALNTLEAFNKIYSLFVVLGLTIAISTLLKSTEEIKKVIVCFSASGFLLFVLLSVTNQLLVSERLGESLFGNANVFAVIVMLAAMCSIWLVVYDVGFKKYIYLAFLATEFYMLFLSGGRKYILVSALFLYLLLIFKKDKKGKSKKIQYTVLFIVIVAIGYWALFNIPQLYNIVGYRMESMLSLFSGEGQNKLPEDMIRENMILYGLGFFAQRPLLGYGTDSFTLLFGEAYGRYTYSHNNFVEILVNNGLVGFVVYYLFYIVLVYKLWIIQGDHTKLRDFFLAFMVCLLPLEMGVVSYNMYFIHVFISLGSVYLHLESTRTHHSPSFSVNEDLDVTG